MIAVNAARQILHQDPNDRAMECTAMLPFKTILVHAGREQRLAAQLAVGVALATRFQSHLIGLAVLPPRILLPAGPPGKPDVVVIEAHRATFRKEAERMRNTFEQASEQSSRERAFTTEWLLDDAEHASTASVVTNHSQAADLTILGPSEKYANEFSPFSLPEHLIIGSGRPVLVVPKIGSSMQVGRRVLIAWNGSGEAAKAAFDALPLLQGADYVKILMIMPGRTQRTGERKTGEYLRQALSRHGVHSLAETISIPSTNVGSALLSAVKAENSDLLVMGCCGRARLYDFMLGNASQHILRRMPVAIFMSH